MDDYDIWNGLATFDPIVFVIGLGILMLVGWFIGRNDKK